MIVNCKFNISIMMRVVAMLLVLAMAAPVHSASKKSKKKAATEQVQKKKSKKPAATTSSSKKKKPASSSSKKKTAKKKKTKASSKAKSSLARRQAAQARRQPAQPRLQSSRLSTDYDGIDVSSYQKDIDWDRVCRDKRIRFVYVKATEGATYTSPHFRFNIENARRHGLKVGSYHFLRTTSSLQSQFENFTREVKAEEQDLVPLIDIEQRGSWSPQQIVDSLRVFLNMVRKHYKCRPMIYTMTSFYNKYLTSHFTDYPLVIARYSEDAPSLADGSKYTLWQYTDQGHVEGIDHDVDMCRFADGKHLADISMRPQPTKAVEHSASDNAPHRATHAKFACHADSDSAALRQNQLSPKEQKELEQQLKKEKKARERIAKEQKKREEKERKAREKEEKRLRKLREKATKDSIDAARKARANKPVQAPETSIPHDSVLPASYDKYFSTRRGTN